MCCCFFLFKFQTCFYSPQSRGVFCRGLRTLNHGHRSVPAQNKVCGRRLDIQVDAICHFQGKAALLFREPGRWDGASCPVIYVRMCSQPSQRMTGVLSQDGAESVQLPTGREHKDARPSLRSRRQTLTSLFVALSLRTGNVLVAGWEWMAEGHELQVWP